MVNDINLMFEIKLIKKMKQIVIKLNNCPDNENPVIVDTLASHFCPPGVP